MEQNGRTIVGSDSSESFRSAAGVREGPAAREGVDLEVAIRLRQLGRRVAPAEISEVWVFPPLAHLEDSAEFLLFTRILPDEMRRLCGAEFLPPGRRASNGNGGPDSHRSNGHGNGGANGNGNGESPDDVRRITEYGAVPSHRVPRLVAGFRERLGDHRNPLHFEIGGDLASWGRLVDREPLAAD